MKKLFISLFLIVIFLPGWAVLLAGQNKGYFYNSDKKADSAKSKNDRLLKKGGDSKVNGSETGEILVKFKPNASKAGIDAAHKKIRALVKTKFKKTGIQVIKMPAGMKIEKVIEYYKNNTDVEYAEPNFRIKLKAVVMPNDPKFSEQWGLNNTGQSGGTADADIDAPDAWGLFKGDSSFVVGMLDSGIDYTHEDLKNNIWINPYEIAGDGIDNDENGYVDDIYGLNAINNDGNLMDDNGHGTHIAGIIGGAGNNNKGIAGVSWNVKLMGLKCFDEDGYGDVGDAIECMEYVLDLKKKGINIKVINNSWSINEYSFGLFDLVKNLRDADILLVAAAGNESADNDLVKSYPANFNLDNIISVAATDKYDTLASFSNYGIYSVDLAAPGVDIISSALGGGYIPQAGDIFFDDMEGGEENWTHSGINDSWVLDNEAYHSINYSWNDSPAQDYLNNTDSYLEYGSTIDLSNYAGINLGLGFWAKIDIEDGWDYLYVEISKNGGLDFEQLVYLTGEGIGWKLYSFKIPENYKTDKFCFRFHLITDEDIRFGGVNIDDVGIGSSMESNNYISYSGTSMAAPYVSGTAALLWGYRPNLNYLDVADIILTSVDPVLNLKNKIRTKGRLNAYKALQLDPSNIPPIITELSHNHGPVNMTMNIKGRRFGVSSGAVKFFSNKTASISSWTDTLITCTVPEGAQSGDITVTTIEGKTASIFFKVGEFFDMHAFIPIPVYRSAAASLNGNIYVIGGYINKDEESGYVQIYDPAYNIWKTGAVKPTPVVDACAGILDNKIYVIGGYTVSMDNVVNKVEIYDPLTDSWSETTPLPKELYASSATILNGKIYIIGGFDSLNEVNSVIYQYNSINQSWNTSASPLNYTRGFHGAGVIEDKIYVFGGINNNSVFLNSAEVYNPSTNKWTLIASMNFTRYDFGNAVVDGKLYAFGGNYMSSMDPPYLDNLEVYDPKTNKWEINKKLLNKARQGVKGAVINSYIFALGGYDGSVSDICESLNIAGEIIPFDPIYILSLTVNPASGLIPLPVEFNVTMAGGSGNYNYSWDYGDGTTVETAQNPKHTYLKAGGYTAVVTIIDKNDPANYTTGVLYVSATDKRLISISVMSATPSVGAAPQEVIFNITPTGGSGNYDYSWDYGDGTAIETAQNPKHTYMNAGIYIAEVTVKDKEDPSISTKGQLHILIKSVDDDSLKVSLDASSVIGIVPLLTEFKVGISGGAMPYNLTWNFGDGTTPKEVILDTTSSSITHTYTTVGDYSAVITVKSTASGGKPEMTVSSTVEIKVSAASTVQSLDAALSASPNTGKEPLNTEFSISISGGVKPYTLSWNFGDGTPPIAEMSLDTTLFSKKHTYAYSGEYNAAFTVKSPAAQNNPEMTVTRTVKIKVFSADTAVSGGNAGSNKKKGLCFIDTAFLKINAGQYSGSLKKIRDDFLMKNSIGNILVNLYYKASPYFRKIILTKKL
ncbi:S8 family serine peptidase [Candidatus Desantisbacteria bacterium]|nr:S8 family serine peptidase [Candidatus Desantisbacteria bacterium]